MKSIFTGLLITGMFFISFKASAQQGNKEKISKALTEYFYLERENIHAHLDKSIFMSNEQIWFRGYVFHRKNNVPFISTTNIFGSLIDKEGKVIDNKLFYGSLGSFSGSFQLNDSIKTGKYYVQFYTNWMNNFTEDESSVYEITIINPNDGTPPPVGRPDKSNVNINFRPEGGTLLYGAHNIVGISLSGCDGNTVAVDKVEIAGPDGKIIKTVPVNKQGHGKFDLPNPALTGYKAIVTIEGKKYEQPLPNTQVKGVAIEANTYSIQDKAVIKLRTNKPTFESFSGKPIYMLIHQDDKTGIYEVAFDPKTFEQTVVLTGRELFDGINNIRILDSNLDQLAERLIYKYLKSGITTELVKTGQDGESFAYKGKAAPNMSLSISVLPVNSLSINNNSDIYTSLLFAPYLDNQQKISGKYYLNTISRAKQYELDLFLLNQKSKYDWKNIMNHPPKSNYTFDIGLSLKGTINQTLKNKQDYKVRIYSTGALIDELVEVNEKNEFYLNNLILADSTNIKFGLMEKGVKKQDLKLYPQIFNNKRSFNKSYSPGNASCSYAAPETGTASFELPKYITNTIELEEVKITSQKKQFKYARVAGNSQLRPYKITDVESKMFFYILDYIRYHGFDVEIDGSTVGIWGRTVNTINGQRTRPLIWVDNMQLLSFDQLLNIQTADVDEFYVNQHAVVPGVDNRMGRINIFMKKDFSYREKKHTETSFMIKEGFAKITPFKNAVYTTSSGVGFQNFGLIDWQPVVMTDEKGEFTISIPRSSYSNVLLQIEGFGGDGSLVSETKVVATE